MSVDPVTTIPAVPRPSLFDRLMFLLLFPALLLPMLAVHYGVIASLYWAGGSVDYGFVSGGVSIYMFILMGSMTLNAWLLVRHPDTLATGALPRRVNVLHAWLYGLLIVWILTLMFGLLEFIGLLFAVVGIVLSVLIAIPAATRFGVRRVAPLTALTLRPGVRVALTCYFVLCGLALVWFAIQAVVAPFDPIHAGGGLGVPVTWALLALGLPWSYLLYLVTLVPQVMGYIVIATGILAATVVANGLLVGYVLWSKRRGVGVANWFFRLGSNAAADRWRARVDAVWASELTEPEVVTAIDALVAERPAGDPSAVFEAAGARDFAGRESEAEPLYRRALSLGLAEPERGRAVIQLASTLRNLGRSDEALVELDSIPADHPLAGVADAFRVLVRADPTEVATLIESSATLPEYSGVVRRYAEDLLGKGPVT